MSIDWRKVSIIGIRTCMGSPMSKQVSLLKNLSVFFCVLFLFAALLFSASRPKENMDPPPQNASDALMPGEPAMIGQHVIIEAPDVSPYSTSFFEVWAYLIADSEEYLDNSFPITDLGYFSAEVNTYGELVGVPNPRKLSGYPGRIHMVVACNSTSLTHFALAPDGKVRGKLIDDLVKATENFDGLQIDFELVPKRDKDTFHSFIKELRERLPHKILSVALPARTRTLKDDVYDYKRLSALVDKVFVMAYDEHWATSRPGPIASIGWCNNIAEHSLETIGREKLVMGLPFYGRTWGEVSLNRAFYFSGIQRTMRENGVTAADIVREEHIPTFTYEVPSVTVTSYYDDVQSLSVRLDNYFDMGVKAVGFWCLGQEDPRIWSHLSVSRREEVKP